MISVQVNEIEKLIKISFKFNLGTHCKEINGNRALDDSVESTFKRLCATINKKFNANPKLDETSLNLYDLENNLIPLDTRNKDAWKENFTLKINELEFKVFVNLPSVKAISLPKILVAGLPAVVKVDFDSDETTKQDLVKHSLFKWYISENAFDVEDKKSKNKCINLDTVKWTLINEGLSKRMIILNEMCENRLIKVECHPKDDQREGFMLQAVSANPVLPKIDKEQMPMKERHKQTINKLNSDS
jgi:hypothetical protein